MANSREPEDKKDDDGYGIGEGLGLGRPAGSVLPPPESSDASNAPSPIPPPARPAKVSVAGGSKGGSAAGSAANPPDRARQIAKALMIGMNESKLIDLIRKNVTDLSKQPVTTVDNLMLALASKDESDFKGAFDKLFPSLSEEHRNALLQKREKARQDESDKKLAEFNQARYKPLKKQFAMPTSTDANEFNKYYDFYFLQQHAPVPAWIKQKELKAWMLRDVSHTSDDKMKFYFKSEAFLDRLIFNKGSEKYSEHKKAYGEEGCRFVLSLFMSGQSDKDFPDLKSLPEEFQHALKDETLKEKTLEQNTQKYSVSGEPLAKLPLHLNSTKAALYQYLQNARLDQEAEKDPVFKSILDNTRAMADKALHIQWGNYQRFIQEQIVMGEDLALLPMNQQHLKLTSNFVFLFSLTLPAWISSGGMTNMLFCFPEFFEDMKKKNNPNYGVVLEKIFGKNFEHADDVYQFAIEHAKVNAIKREQSELKSGMPKKQPAAKNEEENAKKLIAERPALDKLLQFAIAERAEIEGKAEVKHAASAVKLVAATKKKLDDLDRLRAEREEKRKAIEARREKEIADRKAAEEAKKLAAEQKRLAEEKRVAEEKLRVEEIRVAEEKRRAEEALRLAEEKRQVDARNKLMAEMQERAERERQEREQKEKIERDRQAVEDLKQADIKAQAVVSRYFDNLEKTSAVSAAAHHQVLSFATLFKTVTARDAQVVAERKEVSLPVAVRRKVVSLDEKEMKGAEHKESKRAVRDDFVTTIKKAIENPTLAADDAKGARIRAGQAAVNWVDEKADEKKAPSYDAKTTGCYVESVHRVNDRDRYQISVQRMPPSLDRATIATNVLRNELKDPAFECKAEIWDELKLPDGFVLKDDLPAVKAVLQKMGGIEAKQQEDIAVTISNAFNDAWAYAVDAKNGIYIPSVNYLKFANMQDNTFTTEMGVNRMCYVRPNEDVLMVKSYILIRAAKNLPYTNESKYKYKPSEQEIEAVRDLLKQGKLLNAMPAELKTQVDALKEAAKNVSGASHKEITDYIEQMSAGINLTEKDRDRVTDLMSSITSRLRPS